MGFFSSLLGGSNPTLNTQIPALGAVGADTTKQGQGDMTAASNFWQNILSGHASQSLAPQISDIQKQGSEKLNSMAQFGNRSGGNNSAASMVTDNTNASINDLIAKLTGSAATNLGNLGVSSTQLGLNAYQQQASDSQQQMQNWKSSILGQGITGAINYATSFLPVAHGG